MAIAGAVSFGGHQRPRRRPSQPPGDQYGVQQKVYSLAGVESHTPHDAHHAMGRHLIENTGNIAAVQR
ncbi:MAG: hypothetical protein JRD84_08605 [Deltaproteobacteria bacterium]|nr:hypothetical protein [Deltaproteobacteria bacterium]